MLIIIIIHILCYNKGFFFTFQLLHVDLFIHETHKNIFMFKKDGFFLYFLLHITYGPL